MNKDKDGGELNQARKTLRTAGGGPRAAQEASAAAEPRVFEHVLQFSGEEGDSGDERPLAHRAALHAPADGDQRRGELASPPSTPGVKKVKLKLRHGDGTRLVVVKSGDTFLQLKTRLEKDYGFQVELRYRDGENDEILLQTQNDLNELIENEAGTVSVTVTKARVVLTYSGGGGGGLNSETSAGASSGGLETDAAAAAGDFAYASAAQMLPVPQRSELLLRRPGLKLTRALSDCHLNAVRPTWDGRMLARTKIRWRRGEEIGRGAYGVVYLGLNLDTGEIMAVKVMHTEGLTQKEVDAFENEVNVLRRTSHRNIVKYYGVERTESALSVFLEYVPGGSVLRVLSSVGHFGEQVIRLYSRQLLLGLEFLHRNGLAHRDIKAANALVDNDGSIKLADFGLAKSSRNQFGMSTSDAGVGGVKGTPFWMAPEILQQAKLSFHGWQKADVWSFGCTVVEMATGSPPWGDEPMAALYKLCMTEEVPDLPAHLSESAKDFLRHCFQRDPSRRPDVSKLLRHPWLAFLAVPSDSSADAAAAAANEWGSWGDSSAHEHYEYQEYASERDNAARIPSDASADMLDDAMGSFDDVNPASGFLSTTHAAAAESFPYDPENATPRIAAAQGLPPPQTHPQKASSRGIFFAQPSPTDSAAASAAGRLTNASSSAAQTTVRARPLPRLVVSDETPVTATGGASSATLGYSARVMVSGSASSTSTPSLFAVTPETQLEELSIELTVGPAPAYSGDAPNPTFNPGGWARGAATSPGPRAAAMAAAAAAAAAGFTPGAQIGSGLGYAFPAERSPYHASQPTSERARRSYFFSSAAQPAVGAAVVTPAAAACGGYAGSGGVVLDAKEAALSSTAAAAPSPAGPKSRAASPPWDIAGARAQPQFSSGSEDARGPSPLPASLPASGSGQRPQRQQEQQRQQGASRQGIGAGAAAAAAGSGGCGAKGVQQRGGPFGLPLQVQGSADVMSLLNSSPRLRFGAPPPTPGRNASAARAAADAASLTPREHSEALHLLMSSPRTSGSRSSANISSPAGATAATATATLLSNASNVLLPGGPGGAGGAGGASGGSGGSVGGRGSSPLEGGVAKGGAFAFAQQQGVGTSPSGLKAQPRSPEKTLQISVPEPLLPPGDAWANAAGFGASGQILSPFGAAATAQLRSSGTVLASVEEAEHRSLSDPDSLTEVRPKNGSEGSTPDRFRAAGEAAEGAAAGRDTFYLGRDASLGQLGDRLASAAIPVPVVGLMGAHEEPSDLASSLSSAEASVERSVAMEEADVVGLVADTLRPLHRARTTLAAAGRSKTAPARVAVTLDALSADRDDALLSEAAVLPPAVAGGGAKTAPAAAAKPFSFVAFERPREQHEVRVAVVAPSQIATQKTSVDAAGRFSLLQEPASAPGHGQWQTAGGGGGSGGGSGGGGTSGSSGASGGGASASSASVGSSAFSPVHDASSGRRRSITLGASALGHDASGGSGSGGGKSKKKGLPSPSKSLRGVIDRVRRRSYRNSRDSPIAAAVPALPLAAQSGPPVAALGPALAAAAAGGNELAGSGGGGGGGGGGGRGSSSSGVILAEQSQLSMLRLGARAESEPFGAISAEMGSLAELGSPLSHELALDSADHHTAAAAAAAAAASGPAAAAAASLPAEGKESTRSEEGTGRVTR